MRCLSDRFRAARSRRRHLIRMHFPPSNPNTNCSSVGSSLLPLPCMLGNMRFIQSQGPSKGACNDAMHVAFPDEENSASARCSKSRVLIASRRLVIHPVRRDINRQAGTVCLPIQIPWLRTAHWIDNACPACPSSDRRRAKQTVWPLPLPAPSPVAVVATNSGLLHAGRAGHRFFCGGGPWKHCRAAGWPACGGGGTQKTR
jgi:hypothetical protein